MQVHLVVRPTTARIFYCTRSEISEFRAWIPYLDEEVDKKRKKEALLQCGKLAQRWISVLAPRIGQDKQRGGMDVREGQIMSENLLMHSSLLRILSLPLPRQPARRMGELDIALDGDRRDLFGTCHELVQRLCDGNTRMQHYFFEHRGIFINQMGLNGLDVASTLAAMVKGNRCVFPPVQALQHLC